MSTGPAESATATGAKLTGSLSPDGADTHYYFEYGTSRPYGSVSPSLTGTDAGSASKSLRVETMLTGLVANTVYQYRLVGVSSFGTTFGENATFTTPGPPTIGGESAQVNPSERTGQTSAALQGKVTLTVAKRRTSSNTAKRRLMAQASRLRPANWVQGRNPSWSQRPN